MEHLAKYLNLEFQLEFLKVGVARKFFHIWLDAQVLESASLDYHVILLGMKIEASYLIKLALKASIFKYYGPIFRKKTNVIK